MIIIGRPYNTCDSGVNLELPKKLKDLGELAVPMDFLPLDEMADRRGIKEMYWRYGQRILCAGHAVKEDPRLHGVYISNFGCGADSFIGHFFRDILKGKPYLQLEIDEHSADAGIITRCEAFIDTIRNAGTRGTREPIEVLEFISSHTDGRRICLPYMIDHCYVLAAAMRYCGANAEALPLSDELTLELG